MDKITRLSDCSMDQAVCVWNEGFTGYLVNVTMTLDQWLRRIAEERLSPELSLVAWQDGNPVGCVVNGIRKVGGKRIAWNGGTAVVPRYRRRGVGRRLMEACIDVYREMNVDEAWLEVISLNTPAIALYESFGYKTEQVVTCFVKYGSMEPTHTASDPTGWTAKLGLPHEILQLPFYKPAMAWQNQWQSLAGGQSLTLYSPSGSPVAYALFRCAVSEHGEITAVNLYQLELASSVASPHDVILHVLREVFGADDAEHVRMVMNIPPDRVELVSVLQSMGFKVLVDQLSMVRQMKG